MIRKCVTAGVVIAFVAGSAPSEAVETTYKSVKEVCLFSPTVPPANSALAVQNMGGGTFDRANSGYELLRDFEAQFAGQAPVPSGTIIGRPATATAAIFLNGIYVSLRYSGMDGKDGDTGMAEGAGASFSRDARNAETGSPEDPRPRFKVSGVSGMGIERNGFVAGFNFKY